MNLIAVLVLFLAVPPYTLTLHWDLHPISILFSQLGKVYDQNRHSGTALLQLIW